MIAFLPALLGLPFGPVGWYVGYIIVTKLTPDER